MYSSRTWPASTHGPHLFRPCRNTPEYPGLCALCLGEAKEHGADIAEMRAAVGMRLGSAKEAQDLPLEDLEEIFKLVSNEFVSEEERC